MSIEEKIKQAHELATKAESVGKEVNQLVQKLSNKTHEFDELKKEITILHNDISQEVDESLPEVPDANAYLSTAYSSNTPNAVRETTVHVQLPDKKET